MANPASGDNEAILAASSIFVAAVPRRHARINQRARARRWLSDRYLHRRQMFHKTARLIFPVLYGKQSPRWRLR